MYIYVGGLPKFCQFSEGGGPNSDNHQSGGTKIWLVKKEKSVRPSPLVMFSGQSLIH